MRVNDPSVPTNSESFLVQRIMAKNGASNVWLEVGWVEYGRWLGSNGWPEKRIYTYDTAGGGWRTYSTTYPIAYDDVITVRILHSECTSDTLCAWTAQLFWNGAWRSLRSVSLALIDNAYIEEFTETWDQTAAHFSISVDGGVDWYDTKLRISSGSWPLWSTDFATIENA